MKSNKLVQMVVLVFFSLTSLSFGAPVNHGIDPSKNPILRPEGKWDITKHVYLLSAVFKRPISALEREYKEELPIALQAAVKNKDESKISPILAELFTTITDDQKRQLIQVAEKIRQVKEDEETTDAEAIALLDRLIWGAKGLIKDPLDKNEKNIAFLKNLLGDPEATGDAQKGAFQLAVDSKQDILAAIKTANDPDTNDKTRKLAKKFLRKELSRDAIMAYIEGQLASGNKEAALDLASAVSWTDPKSGQRFLEFFNGEGAERLYLGQDRDTMQAALEKYSKDKGGLHTAILAKDEHKKIRPKEYVATEHGLEEGRPAVTTGPSKVPVKKISRRSPRVSVAQDRTSAPRARKKVAGTTRKSSTGTTSALAAKGKRIFERTCTAACHSTGDSWPRPREAMWAAVDNDSMPQGSKLTASEKAALLAYLK